MATRGILVALAVLGTTVCAPHPASAARGSATDELRRHFDDVFTTIRSPAFVAGAPEGRRDAVRRIGDRLFNWTEMSRRTLGAHWNERTAAERRAFTDHFARLAERAYLRPVEQAREGRLMGEPVRYLGERMDGRDTIVATSLVYLRDLPVEFRMRPRAGRWEVTDVLVHGVSATENYAAQVRRVIARGSFPALADLMLARAGSAPPSGTPLIATGFF